MAQKGHIGPIGLIGSIGPISPIGPIGLIWSYWSHGTVGSHLGATEPPGRQKFRPQKIPSPKYAHRIALKPHFRG